MVMQIRRTSTLNNPPTGLAEGQLAVGMADTPPSLWVGVPTGINAAGRVQINSNFTSIAAGLVPPPGGSTPATYVLQANGTWAQAAPPLNSNVPQTMAGTSGTVTSQSVSIAATGTFTLTLPTQHAGDWLFLKTTNPQIVKSASANVVPQIGGPAGTAIFPADAPHWCVMQYDGTNWTVFGSA